MKIYDKGERVLRIEVMVHNAHDLRCGKVLEKLPVLLGRMSGMLVRFLDTVQAAHVSFLDQGAFERWSEPTTRGTRRLAGIDLNNARNRHVLDAVVGLSTEPDGFTLAQVAQTVRERTAGLQKKYSSRSAAYDLAKLRGKKLLHRAEALASLRRRPGGVRTMCAYLVLRDKVIKPLLAGVVRPHGTTAQEPQPPRPSLRRATSKNSIAPSRRSDWPPDNRLHNDNMLSLALCKGLNCLPIFEGGATR